jgi:protein TonB
MPAPNVQPKKSATPEATPSTPTQAKPDTKTPTVAGGGETGGRGTDVVTVNTSGIDFPYPGYLENIVRQIARQFKSSSQGALRAEVFFIINHDGSVPPSSIRLVTRSGVYSFDAEAQGAVEAAANAKSFGPLPSGFPGESLPVTFRFDPRILR